jgi:hypothetical protein
MKISQVIFGLIAIAVLVSDNKLVEAQRRPPGVFSLGEMGCREIEGKQYSAMNQDVPIGFEIYRAVGVFGHDYGWGFSKEQPSRKTACRLASNGEKPKFKTLTLAFGFDDNNSFSKGSLARLSIYKDGKPEKYIDISQGQKFLMPIDVRNTRSLGLELECLRNTSYRNDINSNHACPPVYFFEDVLE